MCLIKHKCFIRFPSFSNCPSLLVGVCVCVLFCFKFVLNCKNKKKSFREPMMTILFWCFSIPIIGCQFKRKISKKKQKNNKKKTNNKSKLPKGNETYESFIHSITVQYLLLPIKCFIFSSLKRAEIFENFHPKTMSILILNWHSAYGLHCWL